MRDLRDAPDVRSGRLAPMFTYRVSWSAGAPSVDVRPAEKRREVDAVGDVGKADVVTGQSPLPSVREAADAKRWLETHHHKTAA